MKTISNSEILKYANSGREAGRNLKISIPANIIGSMGGSKSSKASGNSIEFRDYREYTPGDDVRRIDWRAYARTDKYVLKLFQEEIEPTINILSDVSNSLTDVYDEKIFASLQLAALFIEAALSSECNISWWSFGSGFNCLCPLSKNFPSNFPERFGGKIPLSDELEKGADLLPRRGLRIIISDFLWDISPDGILDKLSKNGQPLFLVCVLSQKELNPDLNGGFSIVDAELDKRIDIEIGQRERAIYKERLSTHLSIWNEASARRGSEFVRTTAEKILNNDYSELFQSGIFIV